MKECLGIAVAVAALACGCGSGNSTGGSVTATIGGVPWHSPGEGFIIPGPDGSTTFDIQGATLLPNSSIIDSNKPQLLMVFRPVPSVGTYGVNGGTLVVEYQTDPEMVYCTSTGSVQITSITALRAKGAFNLEVRSPIANPMMLALTDGVFDVPVFGP